MRKIVLKRTVTASDGRNGQLETSSGSAWELNLPQELGGDPKPTSTNPEELFAAGYSACFASSLEYILKSEEIAYESLKVTATALLLKDDEHGGFKFALDVKVQLLGISKEEARPFIDAAYAFCPYSRAIKDNVEVAIELQ